MDKDSDEYFFKHTVKDAVTPRAVLRIITDNEHLFGGDPYYRELRDAVIKQALLVLGFDDPPT